VRVAMLEEVIQKIKPIRFKNNISLVRKYHDKLPPLTKDERDKLCLAQLLVCSWAAFPDAECYHGRSCQADGDVRQ